MLLKIQKFDIKISGFRQKFQNTKKKKKLVLKKKRKCFYAYGHVSQS